MDTSSEPSRPSKKRRASQEPDDSNEPATPMVKKSTEFWLEDGNLVLQTSTTQFRVHKSVLKIHSSFFRDMFTVPQPDDGPMVDGCPLVPVSDSDADWNTMLMLMYHTNSAYDCNSSVTVLSSDYMLAMLRMGQKYGFDRFKDEALKQVHRLFPRTLDGFDDVVDKQRAKFNPCLQTFQSLEIDDFELLKVLTELRIETALPMAYFFCVRDHSLKTIFANTFLSNDMKFALALGKEQIVRRYLSTTGSWWHKRKQSATCTSPEMCKRVARFTLRTLLAFDPTEEESKSVVIDALDPRRTSSDQKLCPGCEEEAGKAHTAARQTLVDDLPSIFGLPPWDQLKDF